MIEVAQVRTRKRGKTWSYIFEAGKVDGRRKVVERGGYSTKDAAYKAGVSAFNDFMHGNIGITSEAVTLKDFMAKWLREVVSVGVNQNTMQTYQTLCKTRIIPYLGEVKVQDLTPAMIDGWLRKLLQKNFSRNTLLNTHGLIHNALNYAVHPAQLISSNPAAYIKVPKSAPRNVVKRHIISPERFAALLEKYPFGTPLYIPLLLLYHTGMRLGEVLGLCWSDVDFKSRRINLRRQLLYLRKQGHFFAPLKTESSERYILVDDYLLGELRRWQSQQVANEKIFGGSYVYVYRENDGHIERRSKGLPAPDAEKVSLICTRDNGKIIQHNVIVVTLRNEGLNAHSFRHTHATQLIESGAAPKGVAGRLGHANTQITQNLYTHNTLKLQEETLAVFDKNLQTSS